MTATATIEAAPDAVFAVLADPSTHAAIDGTGWVREPRDQAPLTGAGQVFRMGMYHRNHPDGNYEMANRVEVFDAPTSIAWMPGSEAAGTGELELGGWTWRYDLEPSGPQQTAVTLTYDWSAVPPPVRELIQFPPFGSEHLEHSLQHLAALADAREDGAARP